MQFHSSSPQGLKKLLCSSSLCFTGDPVFTSIADLESLQIVAPPSPIPYILLLLAVSIIAIVLFVSFPSLRKYRRKRNILVYFLVTVTLVLTLYQAYEVPRRTVYTYYINNFSFPNYFPGRINQFNLTCANLESKPASFYMVINSVNISFPVWSQPEETYVPLNSTAIKVLFTVSESTSPMYKDTKPILFSINENVAGFSFTIYPETMSDTLFPVVNTHGMDYIWNGLENYYELSQLHQVQP